MEDRVSPTLTYFDLDVDGSGYIKLVFSETMNSSSLDITNISIENSDNTSAVVLQTSYKSSENSHIIIISLSPADLNHIKYQTNLATHLYNSFLFINGSNVVDMNNNILSFGNTSVMVRNFFMDSTQPILQSFDLDLSNNSLLLTFSEVINASSLHLPLLTLISTQSLISTSQKMALTGGYISEPHLTTGHPPIVVVSLLKSDLNKIKKLDTLALNNSSTYLSISPDAAFDFSSNSLYPININTSLSVRNYFPDTVDPILLTFALDLDNLILSLFFSETVQVNTLMKSDIYIKTTKNFINSSFSLLDSFLLVDDNEPFVNLSLGFIDRNFIKLKTDLCTQMTNCFISFNSSLIRDTSGNFVTQIPSALALSISLFNPDSTNPSLICGLLDLDSSVLSLTFDEPVDSTSLKLDQLTIQSTPETLTNISQFETLINGEFPLYSTSNSTNGLVIDIFIGMTNLFSIQRSIYLATDSSNSFLSFNSFIHDMNINFIDPLLPHNATKLSFIADTTEPILQNFSLDMNSGYLNMTFDEVVVGGTLNPSLVVISSEFMFENSTSAVRLSQNSDIPQIFDRYISIMLSKEALDLIKLDSTLATITSNTYLTLEDNCVEDAGTPGNLICSFIILYYYCTFCYYY